MRSFAIVLTIGIFVFDLLTPAATAAGILYLVPMMIFLWNPNRRLTIVVATSAASSTSENVSRRGTSSRSLVRDHATSSFAVP